MRQDQFQLFFTETDAENLEMKYKSVEQSLNAALSNIEFPASSF